MEMDCCFDLFCGSSSAVAFENSNNSIPHPSTLTYEGLFSENYFKLQSLTDKEKDLELSQAQVTNPITGETEQYLGLLVKSKHDGVGMRLPIDISVTVDISGSMSGKMGSSNITRLDLAKQACIKLITLLGKDDHLSFSTFNDYAHRIIPLTQGDKLAQEHIDKINSIKVEGGTILHKAIKDCYQIMKTSTNKNRRIIFITDLNDNCHDKELNGLVKQCASEEIYITVIGISYDCNTSLAEVVCHTKGCNYFVAEKEEDIDKYLIHNFNYICFPCAFNVNVAFKSNNLKVTKSIGAGFNIPKEHLDKNKEWLIINHQERTKSFKDKVNTLLLYFKRINKRLPIPVLASFCNYLRFDKKTVCEINTCFPSPLTRQGKDVYMEGGMILLKMTKESTVSDYSGDLGLQFTTLDGRQYIQRYSVSFPNFTSNEDSYSNSNIRNALSLYYYAKWCRKIMKAEGEHTKKKNKELFKQQVREKRIDISEKVKTFLNNNCEENITTKKANKLKKVDDLLKLIDDKLQREGMNKNKEKKYDKKLDYDDLDDQDGGFEGFDSIF